MTEEQILADGHFVKHFTKPKDGTQTDFSGIYCLPKEVSIQSGFKVCIERSVIKGEVKFYGKIEALRIAINNKAQYEIFISMALEYF
jgi:hypothetical protein